MTKDQIREPYASKHSIEIHFSLSLLSDISKISEKSLQGMKNLLLEIHFANITNKSCSWRKSLPLWGQSIGEVQRWKEAAINDSRTAHQTKRQGKPHLVHNKYKQKYTTNTHWYAKAEIDAKMSKDELLETSESEGASGQKWLNEWWHRDAHKTRKIKSRPIWRKGRQFSFLLFSWKLSVFGLFSCFMSTCHGWFDVTEVRHIIYCCHQYSSSSSSSTR